VRPRLEQGFRRLEDARSRALALLEGHGPDALNRPPGAGRWSALQVLHHVVEAEAGTLGYVRKKMQAGSALPRSGVASGIRRAAMQLALGLPLRFRAPAVAATVPAAVDPDVLCARWAEVRRGWQELLDAFPPDLEGRLVFRHPVAGRLSLADTLAVLQAHLDHHVPQLKRALGR
jgi:DinB superfamily